MNEVKLSDGGQPTTGVEFTAAVDGTVAEDPGDNNDKDRVSLNEAGEGLGLPHDTTRPQTISEQIAQVSVTPQNAIRVFVHLRQFQTFLVPYLPETANTIPPFTALRFRLTVQRLYLALEPGYQFVVDGLVSLALWEDKSRSLVFCLVSVAGLKHRLADDGLRATGYYGYTTCCSPPSSSTCSMSSCIEGCTRIPA